MIHDHLLGWPPAAREDYREDSSDPLPVQEKKEQPVDEVYRRIRLIRRVKTLSPEAEWPFYERTS